MKNIRCFVAVKLPDAVIKKIKKIQDELAVGKLFAGKFTKWENLHLTLKFLGEIDERKIEETRERLRQIKFDKFEAGLGEAGVFNERFVRIIWVHILGKELEGLQKDIDEVLKDIFEPESRFMSHLTIARVKSVRNKQKLMNELKKINIDDSKFEIDNFCLMKSELKPEGPVYSVIEEFNL